MVYFSVKYFFGYILPEGHVKYFIIFLCSFFLICIRTYSRDGWVWQNPIPQGNELNDLYLFDENKMIAVGGAGTIIKTTDGGLSWKVDHNVAGVSYCLRSVHFIDKNYGWAVGDSGTILKSYDAGTNWFPLKSEIKRNLTSIFFVSRQIGWAVGDRGTIIKTTDGGEHWVSQSGSAYFTYLSVFFIDETTGWIASSYGRILKTTDGGANWMLLKEPVDSESLFDVFFINSETGWVVGSNGVILKTTDGGTNWHFQKTGTFNYFYAVKFQDELHGWVIGGLHST